MKFTSAPCSPQRTTRTVTCGCSADGTAQSPATTPSSPHHGDTTSGVRQLCIKRDIPHVLMVHGTPDQVDDSEGRSCGTARSSRAGVTASWSARTSTRHLPDHRRRPRHAHQPLARRVATCFARSSQPCRNGSSSACAAATAANAYRPTRMSRWSRQPPTWQQTSTAGPGCSSCRRSPDVGSDRRRSYVLRDPRHRTPDTWPGRVARRRRHLRRPERPRRLGRRYPTPGRPRRVRPPVRCGARQAAELDTAGDLDRFADYVEACA